MILPLPVFRKAGEDGIIRDLTSKLLVQPLSQQILGVLQQRLRDIFRHNQTHNARLILTVVCLLGLWPYYCVVGSFGVFSCFLSSQTWFLS